MPVVQLKQRAQSASDSMVSCVPNYVSESTVKSTYIVLSLRMAQFKSTWHVLH